MTIRRTHRPVRIVAIRQKARSPVFGNKPKNRGCDNRQDQYGRHIVDVRRMKLTSFPSCASCPCVCLSSFCHSLSSSLYAARGKSELLVRVTRIETCWWINSSGVFFNTKRLTTPLFINLRIWTWDVDQSREWGMSAVRLYFYFLSHHPYVGCDLTTNHWSLCARIYMFWTR